MKKKVVRLMAVFMAAAMLLSACGGNGGGNGNEGSGSNGASGSGAGAGNSSDVTEEAGNTGETGGSDSVVDANVPAFEDIAFPDTLPGNPPMADDVNYDYDDMSVHYDLVFQTYSYGDTMPENDPIKKWLEEKYNVSLTLITSAQQDYSTTMSTMFAGGDTPDLVMFMDTATAFTIGEQGLLVDARTMYPYMPQTCKFVTKTMIKATTMANGEIPAVTKYSIQDSDSWNVCYRQDWLDKFQMDVPDTLDELLAYAHACAHDDPDGNGKADTYFILGGGSGNSFQMLSGFASFFGNPAYTVDADGKLSVPMMNGSTENFLKFVNALYEDGDLPSDWYTIEWEQAKSYWLNDRLGAVHAPNIIDEYAGHFLNDDTKNDMEYWEKLVNTWVYPDKSPVEGGKGSAGGSLGMLWAIPKKNVENDQGKMLRILHMLDAMCYGGEAYFNTVQGGGNEVYVEDGYDEDIRFFREEDGWQVISKGDHPSDDTKGTYNHKYGASGLALAPWQNFGFTTKWMANYVRDEVDEKDPNKSERNRLSAEAKDRANLAMASMDRWAKDDLLYSTSGLQGTEGLSDFVNAEQYKFATGERSFDEWDDFVQEWLNMGGAIVVRSVAEQLGCELPDGVAAE